MGPRFLSLIKPKVTLEPTLISASRLIPPSPLPPESDFSPFVHLHVHSGYSELDGCTMPVDLIKAAVANQMQYLAITDHGNLSAWPDFRTVNKKMKNPVTIIYGCEFYIGKNHLVALAETDEGIGNIIALSSRGYLEGFNRKPRINKIMLNEHKNGIILLSACLAGEVAKALVSGNMDEAVAIVKGYQEIVGPNNFFLETMFHGLDDEHTVMERIPELSKLTGAPIVATNDVHYLKPDDVKIQDLLYTLRDGKEGHGCRNCHFRSYDEMAEIFPTEYLTRTLEIAERCAKAELKNPEIPDRVPRADVPDVDQFIRRECEANMLMLYQPEEYGAVTARLEYELSVYKDMAMVDYAYIVYDIIRFANERGIPIGPGRGSAAGSIVMYLLRVTDVEPLSNGLLFERFLAPGRVSMPDVDMDFGSERREEIFTYLREKYSKDNTCRVVTFSKFKPRSAFQDAARSLGIQPSLTIQFSKTLDAYTPGEFDDETTAKKLMAQHPVLENALKRSYLLLKLPRNKGVNACGFAINPRPLLREVPLCKVGDTITSQWDKTQVDDWVVKMDILGLEALDTIARTEQLVGHKINFVPNDLEVFKELSGGKTVGVFQMESGGMTNMVKSFQPDEQSHLTALVAMYRPGPINEIPGLVDRKFGRQEIKLIDDRMEPILRETYGTIVYQEQVMEITKQLAGFTPSEADKFRKGMGKKIKEVIDELKPAFYAGCLKGGMNDGQIDKLWAMLERFAEYGFNKSHAAAYAAIAYKTAYLAHYYPLEFFSAYLTGFLGKYDKLNSHMHMIKGQWGIEILPPSVNDVSRLGFAPSKDHTGIRFGIWGIRGLKSSLVDEITRKSPYQNYQEFILSLGKLINNKTATTLVQAGALECLGKPSQNAMQQFLSTGLFFGESELLGDFKDIGSGRYQGIGIPIEIKNRKTKHGDPMATLAVLTNTEIRSIMAFKETVSLISGGKDKRFLLTVTESNRDENELVLVDAELIEDFEPTEEVIDLNEIMMGNLFDNNAYQ